MDWPSTLPPCPILRGIIDRVAAAGADHAERMWCEMGTYTAKCDICGAENVVQNYGDLACHGCLQGYTYDECHQIRLTDAQWALLRNQPRWIPVSVRLPEIGVSVLCSSPEPPGDDWVWIGQSEEYEWYFPGANEMGTPTHWMPLPEPPEVK